MLLLLTALVVSITGLIPGQDRTALGLELLLEGLLFSVLVIRYSIGSLPDWRQHVDWLTGRLLVAVMGTVPFVVAGASLLAESGGGLYWVAGGIIGATAGAVATAWVLLVEILR